MKVLVAPVTEVDRRLLRPVLSASIPARGTGSEADGATLALPAWWG